MTARSDLATLTESAEKAIDRLFAPTAPRIAHSTRFHAEAGKTTWDGKRRILRDLDAILDGLYGRYRGAPSPVQAVVEGRMLVAYGTPILREAQRIRPTIVRFPELARIGRAA